MIRFEIDEGIRLETGGSVADIADETLALINVIYSSILKRDPFVAAGFQAVIKLGVSDPDSPVWVEEAKTGDVDVVTFIPRKKKRGKNDERDH